MVLNIEQLRDDFKAVYKNDWTLGKKIDVLIEVTKLEMECWDAPSKAGMRIARNEILDKAKITLRTLQRWKKSYQLHGVNGLSPKKKGSPPRKTLSQKVQKLVQKYREEYRWGSEVIQAHLRKDHGEIVNRYRIDRYLKDSGLREKYPCTTIKKRKAKKRKHDKKVIVHIPGEHTQMDVKYQLHLLQDKSKAYVYNFVDHASNWSYKRAYKRCNSQNTKDFMERLLAVCPFKILRLQTDNGVEFTFKWFAKNPDNPKEHPLTTLCKRESIRHVLVPPGEKELQGLVERSHRQDDQELFSRISPFNIDEFNAILEEHYRWRNLKRRFKKLLWNTPNEWLQLYTFNLHSVDSLPSLETLPMELPHKKAA